MAAITEPNRLNDILKWEQEKQYSRSPITVITGQSLSLGQVIGLQDRVQAAAPIPTIVGTGSGVMSALTFGPDIQSGAYVITLLATSATAAFSVVAPDGTILKNGAVATAYKSTHVNFLIANGGTMTIGDVFTITVTAGGTPVVIGGTGNGVMSAITLGKDAQLGGYKVVLKAVVAHGGDFDIIAPDGKSIGRFLMGTTTGATASFTSSHINFTLSDDTDYILGNYFNVIVTPGAGKAAAYDATAVDGTQNAIGFTIAAYDATSADVDGVAITRDAVIDDDNLAWVSTTTTAQKATALKQMSALGIVARAAA